ncbi:MAG: hypothetical protein ACI3YQ_01830 [Prevotella sp.]
MQINIDEFNALIDKRQEMSEEIGALRSKLQRAEEEILMLKEVKVEQDRIVEELKLKLEQKEARIMELTDIIAKSTQNVNVNVFAVITDKNMFPLALEKFDRTFHGLPEDLQVATAGVVMKSLPTELPPGEAWLEICSKFADENNVPLREWIEEKPSFLFSKKIQ